MRILIDIGRWLLWALPIVLVLGVLIVEFCLYLQFIVPVGEQNGLLAAASAVPFVVVFGASFLLLWKLCSNRHLRAWRQRLVLTRP